MNNPARIAFIGGGLVGISFLNEIKKLTARGIVEVVVGNVNGIIKETDNNVHDLLISMNSEICDNPREFLNYSLDSIFSVGNRYIFPADFIQIFGRQIINFHAAPLPAYRGSACPAFAILNNEREFGCSFHLVSDKIDEGNILHVESFQIKNDDTAMDIDQNAIKAGLQSIEKLGPDFFKGKYPARPQSFSRPPYQRKEIDGARKVNLQWEQNKILRHVRACDWPGVLKPAFVELEGGERLYLTAKLNISWIGKNPN